MKTSILSSRSQFNIAKNYISIMFSLVLFLSYFSSCKNQSNKEYTINDFKSLGLDSFISRPVFDRFAYLQYVPETKAYVSYSHPKSKLYLFDANRNLKDSIRFRTELDGYVVKDNRLYIIYLSKLLVYKLSDISKTEREINLTSSIERKEQNGSLYSIPQHIGISDTDELFVFFSNYDYSGDPRKYYFEIINKVKVSYINTRTGDLEMYKIHYPEYLTKVAIIPGNPYYVFDTNGNIYYILDGVDSIYHVNRDQSIINKLPFHSNYTNREDLTKKDSIYSTTYSYYVNNSMVVSFSKSPNNYYYIVVKHKQDEGKGLSWSLLQLNEDFKVNKEVVFDESEYYSIDMYFDGDTVFIRKNSNYLIYEKYILD